MLDTLRTHSKHWIIKILFVLLILSFGVWGIGDVVRLRAASQPAITVGNAEIGARQVYEEFRQQAQKLVNMSKGKITMDQLRQMGVLDSAIDKMVSTTLLEQEAKRLKLTVSNQTLLDMIYQEPAFKNADGKFDKNLYQMALSRAGLNEPMFLAEESSSLLRNGLLDAVEGGLVIPNAAVEVMFRHAYEQRVAEIVTFPPEKMTDPGKPDDAVLKTFYESHKAEFMAPELRSGLAIVLRPEDYSGDLKPSEEDIAKAYEARQSEFIKPDLRSVAIATFADEAKAKTVAEAVRAGKDFAAEAKAAGSEAIDMGAVEPKTIPVPELAKPVFALTAPGIVGPTQSALGWHLAKVTNFQAGKSKPLAEVHDLIARDLVKNEALTRLFPASTELEDTLGSGASLEEAASSKNLKLIKISNVDMDGNGPDGKPAGTPVPATVIAALFQASKGITGSVEKLDDDAGYYVVRADQVNAPAVPALDQIKERVTAAWVLEERQHAARKLAEAAVERLNKGEALAAVAGSYKADTTAPFRRVVAPNSGVPATLPAAVFQLKPGQAAVVDDPSGAAIAARLKQVLPADPKAQAMAFQNAREQYIKSIESDLMVGYRQALTQDQGVKINRPLIDAQFEK